MKKIFIRLLVYILNVVLVTVLLTGCGYDNGNTANNNQSSFSGIAGALDEVKLKMYLIGDKPKDTDLVYAEVNGKLKQDINATVELGFLSWGEWQQKYSLIFAASENFDLIFSANWTLYSQLASKNAFFEITGEMLKKYAPKTSATIYRDAWEQAKVSGKVYMLPMNYREIQGKVIMLRGDIMRKTNLKTFTSYTDLAVYYDACLQIPGLIPNNSGSYMDWFGMPQVHIPSDNITYLDSTGVLGQYYYNPSITDKVELVDYYMTSQYDVDARLTKEWADKGYWTKDVLVNKTPRNSAFKLGRSGMASGNLSTLNGLYPSTANEHPEWDIRTVDAYFGEPPVIKPYIQNGISINKNSKNPERALMILDLFRNDQSYFDLTYYGIKGRHYDISADGRSIRPLAGGGDYPPEGCCPWGWREEKLVRNIDGGIPNYDALYNGWLNKAVSHIIQNFNFDDSKVRVEEDAVSDVQKTYGKVIDFGFVDDADAAVGDFRERLKVAGRDIVTREIQRQIDEFMKSHKS